MDDNINHDSEFAEWLENNPWVSDGIHSAKAAWDHCLELFGNTEQVQLDAMRYQWLRKHHVDASYNVSLSGNAGALTTMCWIGGSGDELDARIDYAMQPGIEA